MSEIRGKRMQTNVDKAMGVYVINCQAVMEC